VSHILYIPITIYITCGIACNIIAVYACIDIRHVISNNFFTNNHLPDRIAGFLEIMMAKRRARTTTLSFILYHISHMYTRFESSLLTTWCRYNIILCFSFRLLYQYNTYINYKCIVYTHTLTLIAGYWVTLLHQRKYWYELKLIKIWFKTYERAKATSLQHKIYYKEF